MSEMDVNVATPIEEGDNQQAPQVTEAPEGTTNEAITSDTTTDVSEGTPEADEGKAPSGNDPKEIDSTMKEALKTEGIIKEGLEAKGINFDDIANEYMDQGELSEETYKALDAAGYPRALVDAYIDGVNAKSDQFVNSVMDAVGGQAEFNKIANFIRSKGEAAVDAYNAMLEGGSASAIAMFLNGQKAEMTLHSGTANRTIMGGPSKVPSGGYKNMEEMTNAMSDPRYKTDAQYRQEVAEKLRNSNFFTYNN